MPLLKEAKDHFPDIIRQA